ncbi:MAG: hypothetical protein ACXAEU_13670 [Candidatus Hodarchaeales archaeon]|jgi:hypothetical protein
MKEKWAEEYDCCVCCKTTKVKHFALGCCLKCCIRELDTWSPCYDACIRCGTTEIEHCGLGYCKKCYVVGKTKLSQMIKTKYYSIMYTAKKLGFKFCSFEEFEEFAKNNKELKKLRFNWICSNFNRRLTPTVVRINKNKDYTTSNIQFITWSKHSKKVTKKKFINAKEVKLIKDNEVKK